MPSLHKVLRDSDLSLPREAAAAPGPIPPLPDAAIAARFDEGSYARGKQYFHQGRITNASRQGLTLKARCPGSLPSPYHVQVTFTTRGIKDASCSCPIGDRGHCKHVAALLLTWQASPALFTEIEELDAALDLPLPLAGVHAPVNVAAIRRRAVAAFTEAQGEWGEEAGISEELMDLIAIGDGYRTTHDPASAVAVYEAVASAIFDHFHSYEDEGGDLQRPMAACVDGLGACLEMVSGDAVRREAILRTLFDIYASDLSSGGTGMGEDAPELILRHATLDERRTVAAWTRATIPDGNGWNDAWSRGELGRFLLELERDTLDDESYVRICRQTGRTLDAVRKLLELGRADEAVSELASAPSHVLSEAADLLVPHQRGAAVAQLMRARLDRGWDWRLGPWLQRWYTEQGDTAAALTVAEQGFRSQPSLAGYQDVRALARALGRWDALRPRLLNVLRPSHHRELLAAIHLDEGELDQAIQVASMLVRVTSFGSGAGYSDTLKVTVARAVEAARPEAAIVLYQQYAEELIALRGRPNYVAACESLTRMRDLFIRLDQPEDWEIYIAQLREENRTLRALKDELDNADL